MPMKMGWRWYGEGNDPVTLSDIKQIPGVTSIVWALHNKMPGEIWEIDEIQKVADQIHAYGFDMDVVESVNVHDDIKIGLPTRDQYIENYKQCIRNLSKFGVKVICYNFMPIFDWTRTDLFHPVGDGSTALFYEKDKIKGDYKAMAEYIMSFTEKYNMTFPGWEPERMAKLDELFKAYAPVTKEKLWENLKYFLEALMPTCHECDIKMAIHMDDPPWDIFGLPRLLVDEPSIDRFLKMVDDPYNCLSFFQSRCGYKGPLYINRICNNHCNVSYNSAEQTIIHVAAFRRKLRLSCGIHTHCQYIVASVCIYIIGNIYRKRCICALMCIYIISVYIDFGNCSNTFKLHHNISA